MRKSLSTDMLFPQPLPPEDKMFPGENALEVTVLVLVYPWSVSPTSGPMV